MPDSKESCPGAKFQISQTAEAVTLKTDALKIEFSLKWGNVQNSTLVGETILRERNSIPRTYEPVELNGEKTFHVEDRFSEDFAEGLYGLGQHQSGLFNYRGATVELGQNNTDVAIPLLLSTKGYAVMWNSASLTYVDNRFPLDLDLRSLAGHVVDYYFIYGPEMDEMIHEYRNLTGHTPLLPQWAYGLFQSKDRYVSQDEVLDVKVMITELDVDVLPWPAGGPTADVSLNIASDPKLNPYASGLPDAVEQQLSKRYSDLFVTFAKHCGLVSRVTFWGVTDKESWKNNWPVRGRTDYPLLFNRDAQPKPAFGAVIQAAPKSAS